MKYLAKSLSTAFLAIALQSAAFAHDQTSANLQVTDAWIRASAPGQTNGAGYMTINNTSHHPDRMISASTSVAGRTELHTVLTEDGLAKMREVNAIDIAANSMAKFSPNGFHVMFLQMKQPFKEGETIPVTLKFEKSGEIKVDFVVKPTTYNPSGQNAPMNHDHGSMKQP